MTAIAKIVSWANDDKNPIWWRKSIQLLLENPKLDNEHHDIIYRIARKEAGFPEESIKLDDYSKPVSAEGYFFEEKPVTLLSLGPVSNVASISPKDTIEFSELGITAIYGDNGAGKTSYAKILKNSCLTRGEKPSIISNIFKKGNGEPSSIISFRTGEDSKCDFHWTYKKSDTPALKSIRVFDSKSAFHYVEKEGEFGYRPAGLHLLDGLAIVCKVVKSRVDEKLNDLNSRKHSIVIDATTPAGLFLKSISENTTSKELNEHCISDAELIALDTVSREIIDLKTKTVEALRKALKSKLESTKKILNELSSANAIISDENVAEVNRLTKDFNDKFEIAKAARSIAFDGMDLAGIGSEIWMSLWRSAEQFIHEKNPSNTFPPVENSKCPLCLQHISDSAAERLAKFKQYISESAQLDENNARNLLDNKIKSIDTYSLDLSPYEGYISELDEVLHKFKESIEKFSTCFSTRKNTLIDKKAVNEFDPINNSFITQLSEYKNSIEDNITKLVDDSGLATLLTEKQQLEKNLKAKKVVLDNKDQIESEIKRVKALAAYSKIKLQTNPRAITTQSNAICEIYLTNNFKDLFSDELVKFGFKNYNVIANIRGSDSSQLFKLQLKDSIGTSVSAIASEGEQKCLALAGVFAELKSDGRKSGVVFDDPVSSLDHKWRAKVAERLVELSREIQVIIFTHDIVFLKLLIEASERKEESKIKIISLDRNKLHTGIVRDSPPWDALTTSKRIAHLESIFKEIKIAEESGVTDHEYNQFVSSFYCFLREAWERLVEEKLLNKTVERFGRGVSTMRLKRLVDITEDDIEKVELAMSKCSQIFNGHDTAAGVCEVMPDLNEIASDIENIKDFEKTLTRTRKRS